MSFRSSGHPLLDLFCDPNDASFRDLRVRSDRKRKTRLRPSPRAAASHVNDLRRPLPYD
jgi:hypothetical protein